MFYKHHKLPCIHLLSVIEMLYSEEEDGEIPELDQLIQIAERHLKKYMLNVFYEPTQIIPEILTQLPPTNLITSNNDKNQYQPNQKYNKL